MLNPELITATHLEQAADFVESQGLIPRLVRRILTQTPGVQGVTIRAQEGVRLRGWDGKVADAPGGPYIPKGASRWEIGTGQNPEAKAEEDYVKRTNDPLGADPGSTAFVFVTARRWSGKEDWATDKQNEGVWREVRVLDADDVIAAVELIPAVHVWISEELGHRPGGVETLERWWLLWSSHTEPALPLELLIAGRSGAVESLRAVVEAPASVMGVRAASREEALGFIAAALMVGGEDRDPQAPASAPDADVLDTSLAPPAAVVYDRDVWSRVSASDTPMILIPALESPDITTAITHGHHVLRPLGPGDPAGRGDVLEVPALDREQARKVFEPLSPSFEEADRRAAQARRSLASLRRSLSRDPLLERPEWSRPPAADALAPLVLAGAWQTGTPDTDVVAEIAGTDYQALERQLTRLAASDDPPFRLAAGRWHLVAPQDAWDLLGSMITGDDAQRWRIASLRVLGEIDPALDLPPDERPYAALRDAVPTWSASLRRGLAEGAALLGAAARTRLGDGSRAGDHASVFVRELLHAANEAATARLWQSLHDVLPLLSEAAPVEFLDAVERGLDGDPPLLQQMFTDQAGGAWIGATSPHNGLLWALEGLCWSPEQLTRAALALGRLAAIDPGGRQGNRPRTSLREVLLPWIPRTKANLERRLQAVDAVRRALPDVGWQLLMDLWPKDYDTSGPTYVPRFRDEWQRDRERTTVAELVSNIEELVSRAIDTVTSAPERWMDLIDGISPLPPDLQDRILGEFERLDPDGLDRDKRVALWKTLVHLIARHRRFPTADWAMGADVLQRLQAVADLIEPLEAVERQAWLFDWHPDLPDVDEGDWDAYQTALASARREAASAAISEEAITGLVDLATDSKLPREVGAAAADAAGDAIASEVIPLLADPGSSGEVASGWVAFMSWKNGPEWAVATATAESGMLEWPTEAQTRFLLALPASADTWELVDTAGADVQRDYWAQVGKMPRDGDEETFARELLARGRTWSAIRLLDLSLHRPADSRGWEPSGELIQQALNEALAADPQDAVAGGVSGYEIGVLIDRLEQLGVSDEELARLEFAYEPILGHQRHPKAIFRELSNRPEFFVELVALGYPGGDRQLDEREVRAGQIALSVLRSWRRPPGSDESGHIDADRLREWISTGRQLFAEQGRADIGDHLIGHLLSGATPDADELWPPQSINELIEEFKSESLEDGLENGVLSARGVTTRGVYHGGGQERTQAERYNCYADKTEGKWPRVTRLLRALARRYERYGERFDDEAEQRSGEG